MKTKLLTILLLFFAGVTYGQEDNEWTIPQRSNRDSLQSAYEAERIKPIKYCMSYKDYKDGNWIEGTKAKLINRNELKEEFKGDQDYNFISTDKKTNKLIKKKAFAVLYKDHLYINSYSLKAKMHKFGQGYSPAYPLNTGGICLAKLRCLSGGQMGVAIGGGALGGALGGFTTALIASSLPDYEKAYYLDSNEGKIIAFDDKFMKTFLADKPEFLKEYMSVKNKSNRTNPERIIRLLKSFKMISEE